MPIKSDCHLHSSHSGDSKTPMEDMILRGIAQGLTAMCFTEHNDFQYPASFDCPANTFLLNVDSYLYDLARLREKYKGQIRILFGVELGLQPEIMRENAIFAKSTGATLTIPTFSRAALKRKPSGNILHPYWKTLKNFPTMMSTATWITLSDTVRTRIKIIPTRRTGM